MVAGGKLGRPDHEIASLVSRGRIGGVIFLKAGKIDLFRSMTLFDSIARSNGIPPLIYATDAEPGMFSNKITGVSPTPYNSQLKTEFEIRAAAVSISEDLISLGINWNFAPVCDLDGESSAIQKRSFSVDPKKVSRFAWIFAKESQKRGVAATAKHFPGHGRVSGDTHQGLVFINGEFEELEPFKVLIDSGIESVMVGHIGVKNNSYSTNFFPASCSSRIIQDLLIDSLGFKGVVVTDAMNMGALRGFKDVELLALAAGAHVVLMPPSPEQSYQKIREKMKSDDIFREKVRSAGNKVLSLKKRYPPK
jgi:beta-N-acetylhexosaminidase